MPSKLEALFEWHLRAAKIDSYIVELPFAKSIGRRWRFDFAFPSHGVAVEVEGLSNKKSRHQTIKGYRDDCEKYNAATLLGWRVFRFTDQEIKSGSALTITEQALQQFEGNGVQIRKDFT